MAQASERPRRNRLSWESRCEVVWRIEQGLSVPLAAASGGCSRATAYRLWRRYREGGWAPLQDRRSTPHRQPRRLERELEQRILETRQRSGLGPVRLAGLLPHPPSTIGKVLRRHGLSRLPRPAGEPRCARRYERARPGELLHVDTKRLGRFWTPGKRVLGDHVQRSRGAGWQWLHVAIDDNSRLAYAELLPSERADDCCRFLARAVAWYRQHGLAAARPLRQRQGLPQSPLAGALRGARDRAPLHPTRQPALQRQGRTADPDPTPRMGLRPQLRLQRAARPRPRRLPTLVQTSAARTARSATGHRPAASHTCVVRTPRRADRGRLGGASYTLGGRARDGGATASASSGGRGSCVSAARGTARCRKP
jgi:Integrase core domain/Winged helix-turn helix